MENSIPSQLFITGTDTAIGKTLVAAVLMAGLGGYYWKPIQSGTEEKTDTQWVKEKTELPPDHFHPETYCLKRPLSPHASALAEGVLIDLDRFRLPETTPLIVEGAGGIMVPLNHRFFIIDLIKKLDIPILLVVSSTLGTINHTLLSLEQLRRSYVQVYGVVMNGPKNDLNRQAIEYYGKVRVCAEIEPLPVINRETLIQAFNTGDWRLTNES